jgi:hypothetical protein
MGLDIVAHRQLAPSDEGFRLSPNIPCFAPRAEGVDMAALYSSAQDFHFRAGSYGGYNTWRENLAKLAGYPATEWRDHDGETTMKHAAACWRGAAGPFSELINFADNEGTIGPIVAKKLAADFAQFEDQAKATDDAWFIDRYGEWKLAFEIAADGGAVEFH